jgi:transposase-like protein
VYNGRKLTNWKKFMKNISHLEWAAESYRNGASLSHLAKVLDCNDHTLRYRLKKAGTEMRPRGCSGRSKINDKRFHKDSIEKIRVFLDQREQGVSVEKVASSLNVTRQAIYALFKAANFVLPKENTVDDSNAIDSRKVTEVLSLFLIHEDLNYVSYLLDMDLDEVRNILRSKDIVVPYAKKEKIGCDQYKRIFSMRKNGKTINEIAEEYDVSLPTISRIIKDIEVLIEEYQ